MKDGSEEKNDAVILVALVACRLWCMYGHTGFVLRIWWNTAMNKWLGKVVDETNQL